MRLGTKLLVSFITVALLVLITGGLSYYLSNQIKSDLIRENGQTTEQLRALTEVTVQLQNSLLYTRNFLIESKKQREGDQTNTTASQIRQAREITEKCLSTAEQALEEVQKRIEQGGFRTFSNELISLADSLETSFLYYDSLTRELFELEQEGPYGDEIFNMTIEPYFRNTLLPILYEIRNLFDKRVDLQQEALNQRAEQTLMWIVLITALAFIVSMALAYIVYLSIARPVQELTKVARAYGNGDFSQRIELNTNDELAHFAASFNEMADNLGRIMVSRSYVNNIIQSMGDMLVVTDSGGKIELINNSLTEKLGYNEDELMNSDVWKIISDQQRTKARKQVETSKASFLESQLVSKQGKEIPVVLSYSYMNDDPANELKRVFVASDITVQKAAEKKISDSLNEKNVLLAEIHHRVKNNLAVISGLLELQIWGSEDEKYVDILKESQLRIQSIALVHEKLYQNDNFADIKIIDYVKELAEAIRDSFKVPGKKIKVCFDLKTLSMTINQAIPFSLILNESLVNIYKHAFVGRSEGEINISLKKENKKIILQVMDNGVGLKRDVMEANEQTLGMTLIDTLTQQLEGSYNFRNRSGGGTCFILTFPEGKGQNFVRHNIS